MCIRLGNVRIKIEFKKTSVQFSHLKRVCTVKIFLLGSVHLNNQ